MSCWKLNVLFHVRHWCLLCRLQQIKGLAELAEWQLESAFACTLHGLSTMKWRRTPFQRCIDYYVHYLLKFCPSYKWTLTTIHMYLCRSKEQTWVMLCSFWRVWVSMTWSTLISWTLLLPRLWFWLWNSCMLLGLWTTWESWQRFVLKISVNIVRASQLAQAWECGGYLILTSQLLWRSAPFSPWKLPAVVLLDSCVSETNIKCWVISSKQFLQSTVEWSACSVACMSLSARSVV